MITDVAVDIDGVLFDFSTVVTKHFSEYYNKQFSVPTCWEFFAEWGMTADEFYETLDKLTYEREIFNDEAPIPKTMVGWQALRDQGLRIHVITHRSPSAQGQTIKWLERYRLIPDTLHFSGQKAEILTAISLDECASIDDHYEQYAEYKNYGVNAYMYTQHWNRGYLGRRVQTLPEFSEVIRVHNQYCNSEIKYGMMEFNNG